MQQQMNLVGSLILRYLGAVMAVNYKAPGALPQIPLGEFTVPAMALCNFHLVKIINVPYGLCSSKV